MYLVGIHAQITSAAEPLLDRTLSALVEDLSEEALRCFRQVKRFGMGGMLRVSFFSEFFPPMRSDSCLLTARQLWKSSSCIRRSRVMLHLPPPKLSPTYTTRYRRRIRVDPEMKISRVILTVSKRR